ncbi:efflux RND transporter periplasmic adaptor subunit [Limnoglobus roseus]|uniref:efflux RND transporter periplasmic adaptor subunit n=1 Tax=Limnoglobus roseus TaxID=2598579 RepID=UPI0011EABF12|nr:efflux RND transporter periplasmic adaptor subunit [Limnoglobus roseus]
MLTILTFAGLAAVGWWGMSTDWKLSSPFAEAEPSEGEKSAEGPRIKVTPPAGDRPGRVEFASADDVARAGLAFAAADTRPLTDAVTAVGTVGYDPARYAQVASRAAGTVWWVRKVPGESVAAGELLALIDAAEVGKLKGELLVELAQLSSAEQALSQLQPAADSGALPGARLREAKATVEAATARVRVSHQGLLNLGLALDPEPLRSLSAADRDARLRFLGLPAAALALASGKTESTNLLPVVAPLAGTLIRPSVTPGETVAASRPLFGVAGMEQVHLDLAVEERDVRRLKPGQEVYFTPDADPTFAARGTLVHVVPEVEEATRRVSAHAEAANPTGRLLPNSFGRGRVVVATAGAVTVPEAALQRADDGWLVFVGAGEAAFEGRKVTVGLRADGRTAVTGVAAGRRSSPPAGTPSPRN